MGSRFAPVPQPSSSTRQEDGGAGSNPKSFAMTAVDEGCVSGSAAPG
jgi:hypothetical protein